MATPRNKHTANLLDNGKILVVGGEQSEGGLTHASAELYDSSSGLWTSIGSMATARSLHTASVLANGKVLVAGGATDTQGHASAELYDPAGTAWTTVNSMTVARFSHTATVLDNGKVLVSGGFELSSAELYDPTGNVWTSTDDMTVARMFHTATMLDHGKVLVVGGYGSGTAHAGAELYDPVSNAWSPPSSMSTPRYLHSASVLIDGRVLGAGGSAAPGAPLTSAELFALAPPGDGCSSNGECVTGFCTDGNCCDTACDGLCEACSAEKKGSGDDGVCEPVMPGTDPDDDCDTIPGSTNPCQADGFCDGQGQCRQSAAQGTKCADTSCTNGIEQIFQCDGAGSCESQPGSCTPYVCAAEGDLCLTACSSDEQCATSYRCQSSQCVLPTTSCVNETSQANADGSLTECIPYQCRDDRCLETCKSVDDCAPGHSCNTAGNCVRTEPTQNPDCSGCRLYDRRSSRSHAWAAALALGALAWRRRRKKPRRA